MPKIDLTPMLNVMMAVLAFFVVISMVLTTAPQGVEVQVPNRNTGENTEPTDQQLLLVRLTVNGQGMIAEQLLSQEEVLRAIPNYLTQVPEGTVVLVTEPDVPYELVIQWLVAMKNVGGDRVSLGVEPVVSPE